MAPVARRHRPFSQARDSMELRPPSAPRSWNIKLKAKNALLQKVWVPRTCVVEADDVLRIYKKGKIVVGVPLSCCAVNVNARGPKSKKMPPSRAVTGIATTAAAINLIVRRFPPPTRPSRMRTTTRRR